MRINQLVMSAFGPFKGVETIDFTKANRHGIFLVSGPTGAGKTTVFDAISFALYGKASGMNRMDSEKTRSHFADPTTDTYVTLEFEVSGRHYRIKRSPKQDRPSMRSAAGFVTVFHQAEFTDLAIPDRVLVKVGEVNDKIESILGLSHDQFRQIVMLPQGEFQALLNASSDARTEIFRRIFDTGFFETLQGRLKEASDTLRQSIRDAQTELVSVSKQIITDERPQLKEFLDRDEIAWHTLSGMLDEANHEDRLVLHELTLKDEAMEKEIDALKERIRTIRQINEKIMMKETLETTLTSALAKSDEIDDKKKAVLAYDQAVRIRPDEINSIHAKQAHANQVSLLADLKETIKALQTKQSELKEDMVKLPEQKETIKSLRKRELTLQSLIERVTDIEEKTTYIQTINDEIYGLREDVEDQNKALFALRDETKTVKEHVQNLENVMASRKHVYETMNEATKQFDVLQGYLDKVKTYQKDLKDYETSSSAFVTLSKLFSKTEASFRETQRLYANTHAARLALDLSTGEPCPVCGSTDHPQKAVMKGDVVDDERLAKEEMAYEAAREAYNREDAIIRNRKQVLEHEIKKTLMAEAHRLGFEKIPTVEALEKSIKESELQVKKASSDIKMIQEAELKQTELRQKQDDLGDRETRITLARDQAAKKLASLEGAIKKTEEDLIEIQKTIDHPSLSSDALKDEQRAIVLKTNALEAKTKTTEETDRMVRQSLDEALRRQASESKEEARLKALATEMKDVFENRRQRVFATEDRYHEALETGDVVDEQRREISDYEASIGSLKAKISQLKDEIKSRVKEDPQPVETALTELETIRLRHRENKERISSRFGTNTRLLQSIKVSYQSFERLEQDYLLTNRITSIARGMTGNKITFERYILAHWLTEILAAANQKLDVMTNGRYLLQRKSEKAKGAGQQGLDLQVFDAYTTSSRDVSTLSGGESFKAALALALGLAEIVQRTSGGISLETMFIDEGFGSLDPESLDIAIETLMAINQTGRVIGVISHVSELKSRIETKIEVDVTNEGSHIRL